MTTKAKIPGGAGVSRVPESRVRERHEFDTLIAAAFALFVALAACWILAHIVPTAITTSLS